MHNKIKRHRNITSNKKSALKYCHVVFVTVSVRIGQSEKTEMERDHLMQFAK